MKENNMKIVPVIVSTGLLVAAIILSFAVSINGEKMLVKQKAIVSEYISKSDKALSGGDISAALKYAKLAIGADPSSSQAFTSYDNAMEAKYKPVVSETTKTTMPPATKPAPQMPSDQGSSMGC